MKHLILVVSAVLLLVGCDPNKPRAVTAYQTVGSACVVATGSLRTLTPYRSMGKLSAEQVSAIDAAAEIINPICGAGDIPSYEVALESLNSQVLVLDQIIRQLSGG